MTKAKKLLKNMTLPSVDLCGRGCNPFADIRLAKSLDAGGGETMTHMESIAKAFHESCVSIAEDPALTNEEKADLFCKSLFEMNDYVQAQIGDAALAKAKKLIEDEDDDDDPEIEDEDDKEPPPKNEKSPVKEDDDQKTQFKKGNETMPTIDVNKMSPEDKAAYEALAKKYTQDGSQASGQEIHPDVKKAMDEMEDLKKSLEIQALTSIAKKYEAIGKKAPELAEKLHELKKAGGTAYDDYVSIMDEMVAQQEASGIFKAVGSDRGAGAKQDLQSAVAEIRKAQPTISYTDAVEQAYRNNPELPETF